MRGFHGDRMQAMTSVNVIRALGLVCETGLISPPMEALWSGPYIGFVHDRQPVIFAGAALHMATPTAPELLPPQSEQAAGCKRSLGTGTAVTSIPGIPAQCPQEVRLSLLQGAGVAWSHKSQIKDLEDWLRFSSLLCHQQCDFGQVI